MLRLWAASMGGMALTNAGTVAVHALAYPIGGRFGVSHGISNAIMVPYLMKFNCLSSLSKFKRIAEAMGEDVLGLNQREAAFKPVDAIFRLAEDVKIPLHLKDLDIPESVIPEMAADVMKWTRLLVSNPRQMTVEDIAEIYSEAAQVFQDAGGNLFSSPGLLFQERLDQA